MKPISKIVIVFLMMLSIFGFFSGAVLAEVKVVPGGPFLTDNQNVSLERLSSYTAMVKQLHQVEKTSKGLVQLEIIGSSNQGRDIYLAKVGNSQNPAVMIITQQHGREPMTTEAALKVLKFLGTGSKKAQEILEKLYVLIVPRVNPDGAELFQRNNVDIDAPAYNPSEGFYSDNGNWGEYGWDPNRYHWVTGWEQSPLYQNHPLDYPENPVPETQAVINAFNKYQPLWVADFHHQSSYVTDEGESVTSSVLWPTNEQVMESVVLLSKQLCVAIMEHMKKFGFSLITQYPEEYSTFTGMAHNGYGLAGAGGILVELRGSIGQKSSGMIIKHAYEEMLAILGVTADGSLINIDPFKVDELPARGSYIPNWVQY